MNFYASSEKERKLEKRIQRIVDLNCRRDQILEAHRLDLEGLAVLATDYEAANMPRMAAELRRRLYLQRKGDLETIRKKKKALPIDGEFYKGLA